MATGIAARITTMARRSARCRTRNAASIRSRSPGEYQRRRGIGARRARWQPSTSNWCASGWLDSAADAAVRSHADRIPATSRVTSPEFAKMADSTRMPRCGWLMAFAALGDGDKAGELFRMLNPINRSGSRAGVQRYKVEPYVMAGDVYAEAPHVGRGGWTWYTGSAGWLYRAGMEWILGFRVRGMSSRSIPASRGTGPDTRSLSDTTRPPTKSSGKSLGRHSRRGDHSTRRKTASWAGQHSTH